jgi:hypothetical protein
MPFSNLDKAWSNLAGYYNSVTKDGVFASNGSFKNSTYTKKPEFPRLRYSLFDDGFIRGGAINVGLSTLRDTTRVGKFFASAKGVLFLTKQVGLQLSNPLLEQEYSIKDRKKSFKYSKFDDELDKTVFKKGKTTVKDTVGNPIGSTRIYNFGINTLAQVAVNAGGIHLNRFGLLPTSKYNYEEIAKKNNKLDIGSYQSSTSALNNDNINNKNIDLYKFKSPSLFYAEASSRLLTFASPSTTNKPVSTTPITPASNTSTADTDKSKFITKTDEAVAQPDGSTFVDANGKPKFKNEFEAIVKLPKSSKPKPQQSTFVLSKNRLLQHLNTIIYGDDDRNTNEVITNPITLLNYYGGPNSIYGIGRTKINTNPDQRTNATVKEDDPKKGLMNGFKPLSYASLDVISLNSIISQKEQNHITPVNSISSPSGSLKNIEEVYGVSFTDKKSDKKFKVDSINVIDITDSNTFYSQTSQKSSKVIDYLSKEQDVQGTYGKDIINFRIEFLDNNKANLKPGLSTDILTFRAYLDGFDDNMSAKWNPYRYMGRGEEFYVYDGFTRDIGVAFTVFAHSVTEMKPLYRKLNYLMSSFAPDYNEYNKMRGNIGVLTVGDYIYRQPGVFTDIKLSGMLDSHWETNIDEDQLQLPKYIKVSLSFKPIHSFLPRRVYKTTQANTSFVTPDSVAYPEYETISGGKDSEGKDKKGLSKYLS